MSARDRYHEEFKTALENEGWTVTDDPFRVTLGLVKVQIDLAAEPLIVAERGDERIVIEIKTFGHLSFITDLQDAVGQYMCYQFMLDKTNSDRILYLGVPTKVYDRYEDEPILEIFEALNISLILYDPETENIDKWIRQPNTKR